MSAVSDLLPVPVLALLRLAAAIARGEEDLLRRESLDALATPVPLVWVDELLLQSTLMVGWPRALSAAGLWRRVTGTQPVIEDETLRQYSSWQQWQQRGEETCQIIYGHNYQRLRRNIEALHPALERWVITEAYGRTLSRPGLPLKLREFCTIAQTMVLHTPAQLHSHLRGALNSGARPEEIEAVMQVVRPLIDSQRWPELEALWEEICQRWNEAK